MNQNEFSYSRQGLKNSTRPPEWWALIQEIWNKRWWVLLGALPFIIGGIVYSVFSKPIFYSQATVASKSQQTRGGTALLSQLGGVGGLISSQLGVIGSNLEMLQVLFTSKDLAESVLVRNQIIPRMYGAGNEHHTLPEALLEFQKNNIHASIDPKLKVLYLGAYAPDSILARDLVNYFLNEASTWFDVQAQTEAQRNRLYLEQQADSARDPVVRAKIQELVGAEIERAVLTRSQPFELLENPRVPHYPVKPQRKKTIILSFLVGLIMSCIGVTTYNRVSRWIRYNQ